MEPPRASCSVWLISKSMLCQSLDIWDPYPHLMEQLLKEEAHACSALPLAPTMLCLR